MEVLVLNQGLMEGYSQDAGFTGQRVVFLEDDVHGGDQGRLSAADSVPCRVDSSIALPA